MASAPPSRARRVIVATLKISAYLLVVGLVALGVAVSVAVSQLPSYPELIRRDDLGQMIRVRAVDGSVIHAMGPVFGEWLGYNEIPPIMRDAMVAVEDRRFRSHPGIDLIGTARGIWVGWSEDDQVRGVSTITQQLARNIFLSNDRSFARKVREGILALALEWRYSKDQILELYLNRVYFGGGAYGIDAASRRFFGHSATELATGEAAIIAGLVKAPSNYSPTADRAAARSRARVVLDLMIRNGTISRAQAARADPDAVEFVRAPGNQNSARYFTDWVLPQLDMLIDETVEPIDVWTTIDIGMQRAADAAINANAPRGAQGALVSLDRDGAVRAMVGGRDYVSSIYNRATQATRQPGSA
ncbi:MAG TPA: transglycosylase domain-containing protein, partial [Allosphingosinicella sp.]|nr:transglycosylase domain-containing protein [Allosphingosinicella sp.]